MFGISFVMAGSGTQALPNKLVGSRCIKISDYLLTPSITCIWNQQIFVQRSRQGKPLPCNPLSPLFPHLGLGFVLSSYLISPLTPRAHYSDHANTFISTTTLLLYPLSLFQKSRIIGSFIRIVTKGRLLRKYYLYTPTPITNHGPYLNDTLFCSLLPAPTTATRHLLEK